MRNGSRQRILIMVVTALALAFAGLVVPVAVRPSATLPSAAAAALSGYPTLRNGSSGTSVTVVQHLLNGHGAELAADGAFGPATESAVKSFQSSASLTADGIVGANTWGALVPRLRSGDSGNLVKALQASLNVRGASLAVDGAFGPLTAAAVKSFQSSAKLSADGIAGPDTWRALVNGVSGGGGSKPETTYPNGQLPASALCSISYAPAWQLSCYAINGFESMNSAFKAAYGANIPITHFRMTAYRTVADQQWLIDNTDCSYTCATPGTSNHGWGTAIDINFAALSSAAENWLINNSPSYGFSRDELPADPIHFHYVG